MRLQALEDDSIYILREAQALCPRLAMLWSIGKDSTVLLWLARKAFLGKVPFPLIHIDTTYKIPEMIAYRDKLKREWNLDLRVASNEKALAAGMKPALGRLECCDALKTKALQGFVADSGFEALLLGIRRDEEGTRAKERVFSPRGASFEWSVLDQHLEMWGYYSVAERAHMRIHPLLKWTELDVWEYISREKIPVIDLYFSKNGRRYRSLGCAPCTSSIESQALTVDEIVTELRTLKTSERSGREQDKADPYAMEKLRVKGYM